MRGLSLLSRLKPWHFWDGCMTSICHRRIRERCVAITITCGAAKLW